MTLKKTIFSFYETLYFKGFTFDKLCGTKKTTTDNEKVEKKIHPKIE